MGTFCTTKCTARLCEPSALQTALSALQDYVDLLRYKLRLVRCKTVWEPPVVQTALQDYVNLLRYKLRLVHCKTMWTFCVTNYA